MSERYANESFNFNTEQFQAVYDIGQLALAISQDRYCSGFPVYQDDVLLGFDYSGGNIRKLPYNNAWHNFNVGNRTVLVAQEVELDVSRQELGRTTGFAHDIRQLTGRGNDERESAEWASEQIYNAQILPMAAAKLAAKAIIGTEPLFDEDGPIYGRIIGQMAQMLEYESREEELFVKSVACADYGDLLMPVGPFLSHMVLLQRQRRSAGETGDISGLLAFQEKHLPFIEGFRYLLPEAEFLATHRRQVTNYTDFVYQQARDNRIETWSQLIEQDLYFMHYPDMPLR